MADLQPQSLHFRQKVVRQITRQAKLCVAAITSFVPPSVTERHRRGVWRMYAIMIA